MNRFLVLVTGSRTWGRPDVITGLLSRVRLKKPEMIVIHGDCPDGADQIADSWCVGTGVHVGRFPALWDTYGKTAGPLRNVVMVVVRPQLCLAFIHNKSKGATGCANLAEQAGIRTIRRRYTT